MLKRVVDTDRPTSTEHWGRDENASREFAIPSNVVVKTVSGINEIASNSRTLATLTETFTSTSEEDLTLQTSSLAYIDSFEVHDGLGIQKSQVKKSDSALDTKFSVSDKEAPCDSEASSRRRDRWPNDTYRRARPIPRVQRALVPPPPPPPPPPPLLSSASGDSWDEQNGPHLEISLLDLVDSRDDEEDEDGHEGDDERDVTPVAAMDDMRRMTMQFQQSHDSQSLDHCQESLPKFAQGPLSHLRDDSKPSFRNMTRAFQETYSSSSSFATPRNGSNRLSRAKYLQLVEAAEDKKKSKPEKSIMEKKGFYESLKDLIYCIPGSDGE